MSDSSKRLINGFVVPADNSLPTRIVEISTLESMQAVVGGNIELVRYPGTDVYVNEEGKLLGLPMNERATYLCQIPEDWIAGDVLMLGPADDEGESTSLSGESISILNEKLRKHPKNVEFSPEIESLSTKYAAECKAAVAWWLKYATKLKEEDDFGYDNETMADLQLVKAMAGGSSPNLPSAEEADAFEKFLFELVNGSMALSKYTECDKEPSVELHVDYDPKGLMEMALRGAQIRNDAWLPRKTFMRIEPGSVMVSAGYGGSFVEIFKPAVKEAP